MVGFLKRKKCQRTKKKSEVKNKKIKYQTVSYYTRVNLRVFVFHIYFNFFVAFFNFFVVLVFVRTRATANTHFFIALIQSLSGIE